MFTRENTIYFRRQKLRFLLLRALLSNSALVANSKPEGRVGFKDYRIVMNLLHKL